MIHKRIPPVVKTLNSNVESNIVGKFRFLEEPNLGYASLLRICAPCIWSFLLCRLIFDFLRIHQSWITY
jgi:hypothetical protein